MKSELKDEMASEMAKFISDLKRGLEHTNEAEDRPLYEKYLTQAGIILSKIILESPKEQLFEEIETNERLWGWTYLAGKWEPEFPDSYTKFKQLAGYEHD